MSRRRHQTALRGLAAAAVLAAAGLALGNDRGGTAHLASDSEVFELLSGIDFVPDREALDGVLGATAAQDLIDLARDLEGEVDIGVRIRAYRALADYPLPATEAALEAAVFDHAGANSGSDVVMLRAAMHSLAIVAGQDAVDVLAPRLNHSKRDVRAAAAIALGETGDTSPLEGHARWYLANRLAQEEELQVVVAINAAIARLTPLPD
jgi:HEAT repeat protein